MVFLCILAFYACAAGVFSFFTLLYSFIAAGLHLFDKAGGLMPDISIRDVLKRERRQMEECVTILSLSVIGGATLLFHLIFG